MDNFLIQIFILILLPLLPAGLLFRFFRSQGGGQGSLLGFRWSFGGAFAGYLIILLILWSIMQPRLENSEAEVWTVRGRIATGDLTDIANRVDIRSIPHAVRLDEDGGYEFKIIVLKKNDAREFPRVKIDLSRLCSGIKMVKLDEAGGTFDALLPAKSIQVERVEATRSFNVQPIELQAGADGDPCGRTS